MKNARLYLLLAFLCGGLLANVHGQVTTAKITGTVLNEAEEELVGATIIATHEPSGTKYGTTTRDDGGFTLPNLRVGGPYTIEVSYLGHTTQREENIQLTLGQKLLLNYSLKETGTTLGTVTITGERNPVISGDRTGAETSLNLDKLQNLPTISRSASDFTRLTPSSDGNSFGGRNDQFNNFSLDGSIFNNPFGLDAATPGGQTDAQPISLDAIDQITVSLAPYDVTQAGFTGAAVNAVTKSGTNQFHGSVFGYFRNQDLTGSKVRGEDLPINPDLTQLQTGFSIGGPIVKNKLFFFANFELDRREDLGSSFVADDGTNSGKENTSRVTANDLQAVSDALMNRFGYSTGLYEGYLHQSNSTKGIFKLDFAISNAHTLTATYNFLDADKDKPAHPSAIGRRGPDQVTLQFENSGYQINNVIHSGILELRSLFGNKFSNKLQVGYTSYSDSRDPFSTPFPVININEAGNRYIVAGHEPFSIHNRLSQDVFQVTDNLNIYLGKHTITAGTSFERFGFDNSFNLDAYGGTFGPGFASVNAFLDTVNNSANFAAQVAAAQATFTANGGDEGVEGEGWALAETNVGQWAIYVQDEYQINKNVNVTLGLRMDMPLYFNTPEKIQENIDRNCCYDPTYQWTDLDGNSVTFDHTELPASRPLISPRLGFNIDLKGDQRSQLRGGTGLFSGRLPFVWLGNQVANPNVWFYNYTETDFRFPQVWRSNLGFDQVFGKGWIATVDLIYTNDINAAMVRNYGLNTPTATLQQGSQTRMVYGPNDRGIFNGYVFTNTGVGYSFNASLQLQKNFKDGYFMVGYNFLDAKDATSIEAEISSDAYDRNPAINNVNTAVATPSLYGNRHRFLASAYKTFKYGNWGTTISTFLSVSQGGTTQNDNTNDFRFSYTYSGDINNDGSPLNDLIYIPTDTEIDQMTFSGDANSTPDEMAAAFKAFVAQDDYLNSNRGQFAEKYAALAPWYSQWDLRILQDYYLKVKENVHTFQFSIDIINFGNMLGMDIKQLPANTQPLGVSFDNNGDPVYSFDTSLTESFVDDFSLLSRWQMRFGLRYSF